MLMVDIDGGRVPVCWRASRAGEQVRRSRSIRSGMAAHHLRLHRGSGDSVITSNLSPPAELLHCCVPSTWCVTDRRPGHAGDAGRVR
jgi:hypothetical protein